MADKFESFNRQAEALQQYPMLQGHELENRFRRIDQLLDKGIRALLETTHFVEDNLCFRLAEIVANRTKAKMYRGRYLKDRQSAGLGITIGAGHHKILSTGFDLFKLSRTSREIAVPLVQRILRSLRLQNIIYEHILRAFAVLTTEYRHICEDLALQQQYLKSAEERGDTDLIERMQLISSRIDQKELIERRVGCMDANMMYGTVALVHHYIVRIDRIQDEIVKAYMRSIPKIVREFARSDLDALDIFQVGCFGLMHAVKVYEYRNRAGFARISRYWIRQRIQAFLKESGGPAVRLPPNVWEDYQKYTRAEAALKAKRPGEQILRADIALELGWSVEKTEGIIEKLAMCQTISLDDDTASDADEFIEREATISDTRDEDAELLQQQQEQVGNIVQNLAAEDRRLICLRFGCIEMIENDRLDANEVFEEIYRQLACKALAQQYMAERIDMVQSMPLDEPDV